MILTIPTKVYAIFQEEDQAVVGPEMDFESLPYYDATAKQDQNPDMPYLAESVTPRPFEDTSFLLKRGVHLHWDFPNFLKRTQYGAKNATDFPPVPDRWLVNRFDKNGTGPDRQWIVTSDALILNPADQASLGLAQTSLPVDIYSGEQPYAYLGRTEPLGMWLSRGGALRPSDHAWKDKHDNQPLTALGWGSPSFDVFYPNCRGVFGFHDPLGTTEHTYKVIGWYADTADDAWLNYLTTKATAHPHADPETGEGQDGWGFAQIDKLSQLDDNRKRELKAERFAKNLEEDLGISLAYSEGHEQVANWARMVCCGEAQFLEGTPDLGDDVCFAMGNTPIEALTALITEKSFSKLDGLEREKMEDSLSAVLMGDRLKSLKLDIGPKFREYRHADEFVGSGGGLGWVIEKIDDNPDKTPRGEEPIEHVSPPPLPDDVWLALQELNAAQRRYDRTARELESRRYELYSDWYRYMHAAYPPSGETQEYIDVRALRDMIRTGSLADVKRLTFLLGKREVDQDNKIISSSGLAAQVDEARKILQAKLEKENNRLKNDQTIVEKFHWEAQSRPAPRFWEPAPPALVIAMPRSKRDGPQAGSPDTKQEASSALKPPVDCQVLSKTLEFSATGFNGSELLTSETIAWTLPHRKLSTDLPIFRSEWETEVYPIATMHPLTRSSGLFDPAFMSHNYSLGENEPDLDDHPSQKENPALVRAGSIYTGSTYVNQRLDDRYRELLHIYRDLQAVRKTALESEIENLEGQKNTDSADYKNAARELKQLEKFMEDVASAEKFLDENDLLVVTLNGFNTALLQRHESLQLHPADPLGFKDFRVFAQDVADALADGHRAVSPDPHAPFLPIRSGALRMLKLRLVDRFGRFTDIIPADVATTLSMTVRSQPDWVRLPPRLSQAARWNFRFLQAAGEKGHDSFGSKSSSPIHGWIVPNLLDHSLEIFDPDGRHLESIRPQDDNVIVEPDSGDQHNHLGQVIRWLRDKSVADLRAFIRNVEEALDNIHPDDREGQSAYSVLMGRPMAVVELGVELELKGLPAVNISWADLYRDVQGQARSTDGFELVKFPYRIGEYRQRNDGLVGYWSIDAQGALSTTFQVNDSVTGYLDTAKVAGYTPGSHGNWLEEMNKAWKLHDEKQRTLFEYLNEEEDATIKKQDLIQPYTREGSRLWVTLRDEGFLKEEAHPEHIRHYAEADLLQISAADERQRFIALLDPHGRIHLSSGIQPVKAIQLPEHYIKDALNRIEMTFLTAPVLSPEETLHISLPKEKDFHWAWRENNAWPSQAGETPAEVELKQYQIKAFQTAAFFPERFVLREGKLVLQHGPAPEAPPPPEEPTKPE
ncbi:MAG: hypothetical protein D6722_19900 [Bacteroidetes bacterium]|nr:MAG: hypothetical protein D6722_19900 [Bacteroidota bacterium]